MVTMDVPAKTTSEKILDAAEVLFAKQGIGGTSLKEITELAQVNIAAVNYHFRTKDGLVRAVYERSFVPLNEQRLAALEAAEKAAGRKGPTVQAVLRAFFEPMLRSWVTNRNFILLIGRLHHDPDPELSLYIQQLYKDLIPRFLAALRRALPAVAEYSLFFWSHFLFGGVVYTLLNTQDMAQMHPGQSLLDTPEAFLDALIAFGSAGLQSSSSKS